MKSLLVDALRQAKQGKEDIALDAAARLEQSPVEDASNDVANELDKHDQEQDQADVGPSVDELELMRTTRDLGLTEYVDQDLADEIADVNAVDDSADAEFGELPDVAAIGASLAASASRESAARFEKAAVWTPVLCLFLGAVALGVYSAWNSAAGGGLDPHPLTGQHGMAVDADAGASMQTHFPFFVAARAPTATTPVPVPRQADHVADAEPNHTAIVISVRERSPAGTTRVDERTFSTLNAAFSAYLAGDMSITDIDQILASRAVQGGSETEVEIKLLLQRYPREAALHRALGTLLAQESRWPEAEAAFARADQLGMAGDGRSMQ